MNDIIYVAYFERYVLTISAVLAIAKRLNILILCFNNQTVYCCSMIHTIAKSNVPLIGEIFRILKFSELWQMPYGGFVKCTVLLY